MKKEKGFSLLLLLTLLTAVGGVALSKMSSQLHASRSLQSVVVDNTELIEARQALLSYSALYPYLYGPRGAGAGHLPCPDTDSPHSHAAEWSTNQGPNPPCGRGVVASGYLPRHISFPLGRYMIYAGLDSRLDYTVAANAINNPGVYPINPSLLSGMTNERVSELQHPAVLAHRAVGVGTSGINASEVVLTKASLLLAIRPSVAAWLIEKIKVQGSTHCIFGKTAPAELIDQDSRCQQINELVLQCSSKESQSKIALDNDSDDVWQERSDSHKANVLLLFLADEIPEHFHCEKPVGEQIFLDYVPGKQHWLLRNEWQEWVNIEHDPECAQSPWVSCWPIYVYSPLHQALAEPIVLRWVSES